MKFRFKKQKLFVTLQSIFLLSVAIAFRLIFLTFSIGQSKKEFLLPSGLKNDCIAFLEAPN
jgi:hypothetical protein